MKPMYESWYERISAPFRSPSAARAIVVADKLLVYIIAAAYLGALAWLAYVGDMRFVRAAAVPAATFVLVSILRKAIDAPRPYQTYDIDPIIHKDRLGQSMPSRHIASAVIISCALGWIWPATGIAAGLACCVVAFTRIVGGVHFPRDVVAAVLMALACGFVGFVLIP